MSRPSVAVEFTDGSVREFSPESWELIDPSMLIMRWPDSTCTSSRPTRSG